jgi:iron complex outermembrane recepter protein
MRYFGSAGVAIIALAVPCTAVRAQSTGSHASSSDIATSASNLGEIVVTAQKRSQNAQDVPIAVTALNGAQLKERGIVDIEGLTNASPGLVVTEFGSSPSVTSINIRGIGQLDYADHQESPNALYVDGAYVSFPGATGIGMYDVDQVEVLRGPQGTLFGRNATGGLVQINSKRPVDHFEGDLDLSYGSFNHKRAEGAINAPITNNIDARLAFLYNRQDGFVKNSLGPDVGGDNTLNSRLEVQWKPDSKTTELIEGFLTRTFPTSAGLYKIFPAAPNPENHDLVERNNGELFVTNCSNLGYTTPAGASNCQGWFEPTNNPWRVSDPSPGRFSRTIVGVTNNLSHDFGGVTFTSITNFTHLTKNYFESDSGNPFPVLQYYTDAKSRQVSQEIRLGGKTSLFDWTTGLYFLTIDGTYRNRTPFGDVGDQYLETRANYKQQVYTYAAFAQGEYKVTSKLAVILGGRVNYDKKKFALDGYCSPDAATCLANGYVAGSEFISGHYAKTDWSGRAQLTYKLTNSVMLYGGVNRGNKGAAIYAPSGPVPDTTFASLVIKPEELTAYEVGAKTELFDRKIRLNGDVFYYDYNNYQALKYVGVVSQLFNANARDYGVEGDATFRLARETILSVSGAYLHTKVMDVSLPDGTLADQQQPLAPKFSGTASLRQSFQLSEAKITFDSNFTYVGSRYYSTVNEPALKAPSYITASLGVELESKDKMWHLKVEVNNLNNARYAVFLNELASTAGFGIGNYAAPRSINFHIARAF